MLDPVGSTSWHNRHIDAFRRLNEILCAEAPDDLTILITGPGGVTRLAAPLLNDAGKERTSSARKLVGDLARYSDQVLRRIPGMPLRSLEPVEVSRLITRHHQLVVVDRSQRILTSVKRDLPQAETHCVDLSFQPIPVEADVVIAFNIVCRLEERAADGMTHIANAVRPGGWLLIDDRSASAQLGRFAAFEKVAPKTYRKAAEGAPPDIDHEC